MNLREITLRNWRSYRAATFTFPEPKRKERVILIGAMNRAGKTSLLTALYLCLFGRESLFHLEGVNLGGTEEDTIRSYRQLLERVIHRPSLLDEGEPTVSVQACFANEADTITITRTWFFRRGGQLRDLRSGDGEEIRIDRNGRPRSYANWQEANNRISDLLFPPHVMPCFFFDGEQAQQRVEASGRGALTEAIRALFGTGLVDALSESLRTYVTNKRMALRRDLGDVREDELEMKRRRRDEIDIKLEEIAHDFEAAQQEHGQAETIRKQKQNEITQLVGDTGIDLKLLSERKVAAENEEQRLQEALRDALGELALPIALRRLSSQMSSQLQAEIVRDRWLIVKEETAAKAGQVLQRALPKPGDQSLQPPLTDQQYDALSNRLRDALSTLWDPPPEGCADDFKFSFLAPAERAATVNRLAQVERTSRSDVVSLASAWSTQLLRVREIRRQWDAFQDLGPKLRELKDQLSELDSRASTAFASRQNLDAQKHGLEAELRDLRGAIGQMEAMRIKLGPAEQRIDAASRVREVIADIKDDLVPLCQESLEESCTAHFRQMISPELRGHAVKFDADLQPMLVRGNQVPIYVQTLSGAQKRAFGLGFALAVADVSGIPAPLIIDTPVGNMDSEFRSRILLHLAKNSPGQVIFLSHDEEIYGEYYEELEPFILKKYRVDFEEVGDGFGVSTPIPDQYFQR